MKKQAGSQESKSLKTFFLYAAIVILCILISLAVKLFFLFQESKFDGENDFTVAVSQNGHVNEIIMVDPGGQTLSVMQIKGKNVSKDTLGKMLGIGVDGQIDISPSVSLDEDAGKQLFAFTWRYATLKTNLTIIDIGRLAVFAQGVKNGKRTVKTLDVPSDTITTNNLISSLFTDGLIASEKISIQIINANDVSGIGGRLERVLDNLGCNVIAVSTSQKKEKISQIQYSGEETYTLKKLKKLFGFPVTKTEKESIAGITIILGEDSKQTKTF